MNTETKSDIVLSGTSLKALNLNSRVTYILGTKTESGVSFSNNPKQHDSFEDALTEAQRLSKLGINNDKTYLVFAYCAKVEQVNRKKGF